MEYHYSDYTSSDLFVNDVNPYYYDHDDNDGDELDDVTSIIQLRLPHCLPPTSSKRGTWVETVFMSSSLSVAIDYWLWAWLFGTKKRIYIFIVSDILHHPAPHKMWIPWGRCRNLANYCDNWGHFSWAPSQPSLFQAIPIRNQYFTGGGQYLWK